MSDRDLRAPIVSAPDPSGFDPGDALRAAFDDAYLSRNVERDWRRVEGSIRSFRFWRRLEHGLTVAAPLAAGLLAMVWWTQEGVEPVLVASNEARIERLDTTATHVAIWQEPGERTTAIWIATEAP